MRKLFSNQKAQAALEYLVTYGWAFLVVIAAIAALSYFGLLNPQKYMPDKCDFGQQLNCVDQYVDTNQRIIFRFQNDFGTNISIVNASGEYVSAFEGTPGNPGPVNIGPGEIKQVQVNVSKDLSAGDKERFTLSIEFKRLGGTATHNVSGVVFTEVSEPLA